MRSEIKVGLIVTTGIAALIAIYWFLGGLGLRTSTYPLYAVFPTAQKLDKGALVRMAGVKIGVVLATGLTRDNRARVDLLIDNGIKIAKDSIARVTTGAFIGDYYVDVTPGRHRKHLEDGDRIRTGTFAQPDRILQQVSDILTELHKSTVGVNELVGDKKMMTTIKDTIEAMRLSADEASRLATAARGMVEGIAPGVTKVLSNLNNATMGASRLSSQIEDMVTKEVRPNIKGAIEQAHQTTKKLDDAIQQAQDMMAAFKGTTGKLDTALDAVGNTATEANEMMSNLKDASAGVKSLATDQQIQQDIKAAVGNAASASQQLKELTEGLNKKYGQAKNTPQQKSAVPDSGFTTNSLWNTSKGDYRFDANYTLPWAGHSFFRAGACNIGENTRANLQGGMTFGRTALRYGVFASRVGVGFDRQVGQSLLISGDIFRPNRPEMELRGVLRAGKSVGIYSGVYDLFHESNRDVYVGIRYQQY